MTTTENQSPREFNPEIEITYPLATVKEFGINNIVSGLEAGLIKLALRETQTITAAAKILKISRTTLFMKMKKLGIERGQ